MGADQDEERAYEMRNWNQRRYFLIPLNAGFVYALFKSPRYLQAITRPILLRKGRPTFGNLFLAGTTVAILTMTTFVSINSACLGINPFKVARLGINQLRQEKQLFAEMNINVSDQNVIPGLPQGTRYQDLPEDMQNIMYEQSMMTAMLLDVLKLVGLSEKTILIIEQDLRNGQLREEIDESKKKRDMKNKAKEATKTKVNLTPASKEVNQQ